jgi:F-type H+-transporting ATPase subunit b
MKDILQDPMGIYAIAFIIFLVLAYKYGAKPAVAWIDGEIAKIRNELDAAYQLRSEAEAALAECQEKQARAEAEAQAIVASAKSQVNEMRKEAERDLSQSLARHKQLATERIHMAEAQAISDVRAAAIDLAMSIARKTLSEKLSEGDAVKLIDQAIADIPALKAKKAEAA